MKRVVEILVGILLLLGLVALLQTLSRYAPKGWETLVYVGALLLASMSCHWLYKGYQRRRQARGRAANDDNY